MKLALRVLFVGLTTPLLAFIITSADCPKECMRTLGGAGPNGSGCCFNLTITQLDAADGTGSPKEESECLTCTPCSRKIGYGISVVLPCTPEVTWNSIGQGGGASGSGPTSGSVELQQRCGGPNVSWNLYADIHNPDTGHIYCLDQATRTLSCGPCL